MRSFLTISMTALLAAGPLAACAPQDTLPVADDTEEATPVASAETEAQPEPQLTIERINDNLHVLFGPGGNIGVSSGRDGVVLIDDKYTANGDEILLRVSEISDGPLLFVINTHLHSDHTGSNAQMSAEGAMVMGHDNIRKRMGETYENRQLGRPMEAREPTDWPVVTFSDEVSLHFNGETARAVHTPKAHTDGDAIIVFENANAIHMGDNLFFGMFPFVDVDSGGSMQGMIAAHDAALELADDATVIIPGHGPLTDRDGLQTARNVLQTVFDRVRVRKEDGQSLQEIIDADPLADMSELAGFITKDAIITAAWRSQGGEF